MDKLQAGQGVSTDLDHEVKLLAERTGLDLDEARKLLQDAGTFDEALRRSGRQGGKD